mgnify:CR=1 FL=1
MLIDKISIVIMLILYILLTLIALFTYLTIVGGNMNKTEKEKRLEDEEQMKFLEDYENRRKKIGGKNK